MIIWQRWGILAILTVPLAFLLGMAILRPLLFGPSPASGETTVSMGIGFLLASAALWAFVRFVVGRVIDKPVQAIVQQQLQQPIVDQQGREQWFQWVPAHDPRTGQPIYRHPRSTLFFVPLRFWPYIFGAIGALALVLGISGMVLGR